MINSVRTARRPSRFSSEQVFVRADSVARNYPIVTFRMLCGIKEGLLLSIPGHPEAKARTDTQSVNHVVGEYPPNWVQVLVDHYYRGPA